MSQPPSNKKRKIEVDILGDSFTNLIEKAYESLNYRPCSITVGPSQYSIYTDNLHIHIWFTCERDLTIDQCNSIIDSVEKEIDNSSIKVTMTPCKKKRYLVEKKLNSWDVDDKKYSDICQKMHAEYKSVSIASLVLHSNGQKFNCYCEPPAQYHED